MKNNNGKGYANEHPDESKASEVASAIGKPINLFKKFQENIKGPVGKPINIFKKFQENYLKNKS